MARDLNRTAADDATDALRRLDALERELPNLRAHLQRIATHGHQAGRSADIAAELARDVAELAHNARCLTRTAARPPLEAVS